MIFLAKCRKLSHPVGYDYACGNREERFTTSWFSFSDNRACDMINSLNRCQIIPNVPRPKLTHAHLLYSGHCYV